MPSTASSIPKSANDAEDTESASMCDAAPEVCTDCGGRGRRRPEMPSGGGAGGGGGRDAMFACISSGSGKFVGGTSSTTEKRQEKSMGEKVHKRYL